MIYLYLFIYLLILVNSLVLDFTICSDFYRQSFGLSSSVSISKCQKAQSWIPSHLNPFRLVKDTQAHPNNILALQKYVPLKFGTKTKAFLSVELPPPTYHHITQNAGAVGEWCTQIHLQSKEIMAIDPQNPAGQIISLQLTNLMLTYLLPLTTIAHHVMFTEVIIWVSLTSIVYQASSFKMSSHTSTPGTYSKISTSPVFLFVSSYHDT